MKSITPLRLRRSKQRKQVSPNGLPIVYGGRPGKWGNPFKIETLGNHRGVYIITQNVKYGEAIPFNFTTYHSKYGAQKSAVTLFEKWMKAQIYWSFIELKNKNISCWCKLCEKHKNGKPFDEDCPDCEPCHVDILGKAVL